MDIDRIKTLVLSGKTYEEISNILLQESSTGIGISARTVRRFCHDNHINKKSLLGKNALDEVVQHEVSKVSIRLI